jgi:sugar phosphate permease
MLILLTNWFTREERSRANAILILGNPVTVTWMAAVTGFLIKAVGWQMTFILEGIPSVLWAFVWISVAHDKPRDAGWIHEDSTRALEAALEAEQTALPKYGSFAAALKVPAVILLCVQYFFWSFGVYGLVLWIPEMIRSGSKIGIETVGLLSATPFLLAVLLMVLVSYLSDRMMNRKLFVGRSSASQDWHSSSHSPPQARTSGSGTSRWSLPAEQCTRPTGRSSPSFLRCCQAM